ncbi:MAG: CDP-diacylglycerol--serine O-phosphatidyltransferase [Alphaproteobacteria bacterium]|nr:CDP-diacylglycerol--serine O-phosphatidyltransferase [Alphaproteobacteria bacterium]MBN9496882.1 CDP-diacylglycerol--serine O-phosphatidyltransferase [Alphaproteobacteria bacterium]
MFGRNRRRARDRATLPGGGTMNRLIPNAITVGALCAGLSGIRFAMDGRWEWAATAIVVAAILDGLDGRMARLLNGTSKFGAELDSLSDFVAFGVAPALVMYMWVLNAWGAIGWMLCLAYAVCMALRLARFNTMLSDPNPPKWQGYFFVGVPAPAGAALALLPLMMHFQAGPGWFDKAAIGGLTMVVVAFLMVSRIPTFSAKKVHIPRGWMVPSLVGVGVVFAGLFNAPWATLVILGLIYLGSIPVSVAMQARMRAAEPAPETPASHITVTVEPAAPTPRHGESA